MATYDTGTVTFSGTTVNGSGVNWQTANNPARPGNTLLVMPANEAFTVVRINSATQLVVNRAPTKAINNSAYCLLLTDALSNDALAQRVSEMTRYYEQQVNAWGQLITASEDVSIVGPDGSAVKVPSLKKLYDGLGAKADKSELDKKADKTEVDKKADKSAFGTAAVKNVGKDSGNVSLSGYGGFIAPGGDTRTRDTDINDLYNRLMNSGMVVYRNDAVLGGNWPHPAYSPSLFIPAGDTFAAISFPYDALGGAIRVYAGKKATNWNGKALHTRALWDSVNTSVDGNGFIKKASPIARLSGDPDAMDSDYLDGFTLAGLAAVNGEAAGVNAERQSVGFYTVTGSLGLAKEGWTIEVPQDINGNRLCFVETVTAEDGTITVRVSKRRFDIDTAAIVAGDPMDIPVGRWIDLRLEMPAREVEAAPEAVEETAALENVNVDPI